jgi:hypothetical protein
MKPTPFVFLVFALFFAGHGQAESLKRTNLTLSSEENGKNRHVIEPALGKDRNMLRMGVRVTVRAQLGIGNQDPVLGKHAFNIMLSPDKIARNLNTEYLNKWHILYVNLKGNGQLDLYHAGEKIAYVSPGNDNPFRANQMNDILIEIDPAAGKDKDHAEIRLNLNGTQVGKAQIDWRSADRDLTLALETLNATTRIQSLSVEANKRSE